MPDAIREDDLLTAQSQVLTLPSPADRVKNVIHAYLKHEQCLHGLGKRVFFEDESDFVALRPAQGEDRLSQFLTDHCNWMFEVSAPTYIVMFSLTLSQKKRDPSRQPWDGVRYGPETRIAKAVGFISVVVAAILLIGAIMSLYFIKNPGWRLGLVAFWTSLFSLSVSILSTARRAEVFGAGAAYAAVSPSLGSVVVIYRLRFRLGARRVHFWQSCHSKLIHHRWLTKETLNCYAKPVRENSSRGNAEERPLCIL